MPQSSGYELLIRGTAIAATEHSCKPGEIEELMQTLHHTIYVFLLSLLYFRHSVIFAVINSATSFLSGFVIFTVLGFMSYETGIPISEVAESGESVTLPMNNHVKD